MINSNNITLGLLAKRLSQYDANEARSIVRIMLEDCFGFSYTDICCGALESLDDEQKARLEKFMSQFEDGVPVQYVTGKAEFAGNVFCVKPGVLIPRPETTELCQWITSTVAGAQCRILDVGTGSGCIAVTLALENKNAAVTAWDISDDALEIAKENSVRLNADVDFIRQDALQAPDDRERYDVIVSNPPYICRKEAADMERNVLDNEPHIALFVPDEAPLLFYRAITDYASHALKPDGRIFFEINPLYSKEMTALLQEYGFADVEIRVDEFGKERMISGRIVR